MINKIAKNSKEVIRLSLENILYKSSSSFSCCFIGFNNKKLKFDYHSTNEITFKDLFFDSD